MPGFPRTPGFPLRRLLGPRWKQLGGDGGSGSFGSSGSAAPRPHGAGRDWPSPHGGPTAPAPHIPTDPPHPRPCLPTPLPPHSRPLVPVIPYLHRPAAPSPHGPPHPRPHHPPAPVTPHPHGPSPSPHPSIPPPPPAPPHPCPPTSPSPPRSPPRPLCPSPSGSVLGGPGRPVPLRAVTSGCRWDPSAPRDPPRGHWDPTTPRRSPIP